VQETARTTPMGWVVLENLSVGYRLKNIVEGNVLLRHLTVSMLSNTQLALLRPSPDVGQSTLKVCRIAVV